jgi:hypothetical protein
MCEPVESTLDNLEDAISRWEESVGFFETGFDCSEEYTHDLFERDCLHGVINGCANQNLTVPDALKARIEAADQRFIQLTFEIDRHVWGSSDDYDRNIFWYYYRWPLK